MASSIPGMLKILSGKLTLFLAIHLTLKLNKSLADIWQMPFLLIFPCYYMKFRIHLFFIGAFRLY